MTMRIAIAGGGGFAFILAAEIAQSTNAVLVLSTRVSTLIVLMIRELELFSLPTDRQTGRHKATSGVSAPLTRSLPPASPRARASGPTSGGC